ncbi:MAG: GNAT family N-acetyltransferase [Candidatus Methanofastidiosia archaeon]|jgi:GNAT superfamily N-acetyltransferase
MIEEFHNKDAQKLADMFNASDEGWPGGFTHGMPVTEEVVLDWRKKENALSMLVVWDTSNIVGMLELMDYWRETNVLYIGFLNVVPQYHGKGYGRDLLKKCVEKSTELQCNRLDLHTWAGNMKAVPVYKKTGFFWVPKTSVHMKNFIPFILHIDAASRYFENHDWYKTFKREIKVEEDDFDGVYPHHWEEGGDMLSVAIDAESGKVTKFENNTFCISQKVEDAFSGRPVQVTWTIKNKMDTPLHVTLLSRGEKGISIDKKESITLEGNQEYTTTGKAFIDPDIEIRKETEPPHVLTTDAVLNGVALSMGSGLRVKHPIDISTDPVYLFLPPGEQKILVLLKNNQKVTAEGVLTCQNTNEKHNFCIKPGYTEGISFTITVNADSELQFCIEGIDHIHTVPVRGLTDANVMHINKEVVLENAHTRIQVNLLGGDTTIYDKKTRKTWTRHMGDDLGPPFWPSELIKVMYTVKTEKYPGKVIAEFSAESKKYNTRIVRRIKMDASPVVKLTYTITPHKDIQLHIMGESTLDEGLLTIPLTEGIVSEYTMEDVFPLEDGDLPKEPDEYKEEWVCYEYEGSAFGIIWESCAEMEVRGYCLVNISMDVTQLRPVYLYAGSGTWKDVRRVWSSIHKKDVKDESPLRIWEVDPTVLLTVDNEITPQFTLESHRSRPFTGSINGEPFSITRKNPFTFKNVYNNVKFGVNTHYLQVKTDLFERKIPVSIVRAGKKGDVTIREGTPIEVTNNAYTMKVDPEYYGSVIFFGDTVNHVLTPYPETTQLAWFRPWYGGIHPVVFKDTGHDFPGRMHKEKFSCELLDIEKHGIPWKGVKVTSVLQEIKGITTKTSYLTCAFSNILQVEHTLINNSSAPFDINTGVSFFLQPDASVDNATVYYYKNDLQERKRTQYGGWTTCKNWAAVKGAKTVLTVISDNIVVADFGKEGVHLFAVKKVKLAPYDTRTAVSYFVLTDSLKKSQQYKVLQKLI